MTTIPNWLGSDIRVATSAGGVLAAASAWDNLVRGGVTPWPPPELIQKIYQSRQTRAFREEEHESATGHFGYYSDLQSLRSEDAITWSVFGPIAYADHDTRTRFAGAVLRLIGVDSPEPRAANVWLWRRLPHPDTLVPGGPEVDFGIQTDDTFLIGESKWLSAVGGAQGAHSDKDQVQLRREFCEKYGRRLLPECRAFVVLGVSRQGRLVGSATSETDGVELYLRDVTWQALCGLREHPHRDEVRAYLEWKERYAV